MVCSPLVGDVQQPVRPHPCAASKPRALCSSCAWHSPLVRDVQQVGVHRVGRLVALACRKDSKQMCMASGCWRGLWRGARGKMRQLQLPWRVLELPTSSRAC